MPPAEIKLRGQTYALSPTFAAIEEIEAKTGSSIHGLLQAHIAGQLLLKELAVIVIEAAHEDAGLDPDAVAKSIVEAGILSTAIRQPVAQFLFEAGWSPQVGRGKFEAGWRDFMNPSQADHAG